MIKTDYPPIIDGTTVSIPAIRWQINHGNVVSSNRTEAGTEDLEILRVGQVSIAAQYRCMDEWTSFFVKCSKKPSLEVEYYDPDTKAYATKTMHMDGINTTRRKYTDELDVTNGIYDITFTLVEF